MAIGISIYSEPGGTLLRDITQIAQDVELTDNEHGNEMFSCSIPMRLYDAFRLFDYPNAHLVVGEYGKNIWEGRIEQPGIAINQRGTRVRIQAYGYQRTLSDVPYTALWSDSQLEKWQFLTESEVSSVRPNFYTFDKENRINIGLTKNTVYSNALNFAFCTYRIPHNSVRNIVGIQFDLEVTLPNNWLVRIETRDLSYGSTSILTTLTATGSTITRSYHLSFTAAPLLAINVFNNTGGNYTFTAENGTAYARFTNVRVVTTNTNRVNTTLTVARTNGSAVTCTVGSTANMYVGQRLVIGSGGANSESVVVLSVPTSTTFTATIANAGAGYSIGTTVQGHNCYVSEIASALATYTNSVNSLQLRSTTNAIATNNLDLYDEVYEDQYPADILNKLCTLGDRQVPPQQWQWSVYDRALQFAQVSTIARAWYVDATDIELVRDVNDLYNSAYSTYQDASGGTSRTSTNTNSESVTRYNITRRKAVGSTTTSSFQAANDRDAFLIDNRDPVPRATLQFRNIRDASGALVRPSQVRAGDTITIRNLPPTISTSIDKIRTFRITAKRYRPLGRVLEVTPEAGIASQLDMLLARRNEFM